MAWTDIPTIETRLGVTVTAEELARSQSMIEDMLGIDETASAAWLKPRELRILGRAVGYQAVYVQANPALLVAQDVVSISQPDLTITRKQAGVAPSVLELAPMAAKVLRHFRYAGPRTSRLESEQTSQPVDADDLGNWQPI